MKQGGITNHYMKKNPVQLFNPDVFFQNTPLPKLSEDEKLSLEGKLDNEELLKMKNSSSPGNSGFPSSFS